MVGLTFANDIAIRRRAIFIFDLGLYTNSIENTMDRYIKERAISYYVQYYQDRVAPFFFA